MIIVIYERFNPRARVGRDFSDSVFHLKSNFRFNPRARVGRDPLPCCGGRHDSKFQSTRPCGARQAKLPGDQNERCFNPRARVGRDPPSFTSGAARNGFNPRARVGRDQIQIKITFSNNSFNPRARVGRDFAKRF